MFFFFFYTRTNDIKSPRHQSLFNENALFSLFSSFGRAKLDNRGDIRIRFDIEKFLLQQFGKKGALSNKTKERERKREAESGRDNYHVLSFRASINIVRR